MIRILFVCHGNICRSTMAEFVMKHLVARAGRSDEFYIDSAATSKEELGNDVHMGTRKKLEQEHIDCEHHTSRQLGPSDYQNFDYIIGMDQDNMDGIFHLLAGERGFGYSWQPVSSAFAQKADPQKKVSRLLDWAHEKRDVADPWYTGDFDATYRDVVTGCRALLTALS